MGKSQVPGKYVVGINCNTRFPNDPNWCVRYDGGVSICYCIHKEDAEAIAEAMNAHLKCTCEEEG